MHARQLHAGCWGRHGVARHLPSSVGGRPGSARCRAASVAQHCAQQQQPPHQQQHHQQRQQPWQRALLESMQQHYLVDQDSAAAGSCAALDPLFEAAYDNVDEIFYSKGGYVIPPRERKLIDATGGSSSYGEIHSAGVDQLLWHMAMDSSSVFVDLGCGRGRAVLQVAAHSPAAACIGLELSDSRLEQADMALQQLAGWVPLRPVEFRRADLSSCSLQEGSHFYLCSTAFGAGICRSIAQRLAASPNFQVLATSRQLPSQPFLHTLGEVPAAFSFSSDGRAYLYAKSLAQAPPAVLARLWCRDGVCWLPGMSQLQLGIAEDEPLAAGDGSRFVQLPDEAAVASSHPRPRQQQLPQPSE